MNNSVNWDHIRFFIEVTKAGSVVKAAAMLGVSHATVLRNISRLEQNLGITLFERLQSGYRITAQGEEIFANALAMQEQAEMLIRHAAGKNPTPEGLLRLAVPDSSLFDLIPLIAEFRMRFPLISVQAERGTADSMARSNADMAIVITNRPPEDLVGRQLKKIEFAYYGSPAYLEIKQSKQLRPGACDWITWGSETSDEDLGGQWQERALRRHSKNPGIVLRTANHEDALRATRSGIGISLLKKPQDELVEVPFKPPVQSIGVWMLTHQDLRRSGRIQAFMDFAADRFPGT